MCLCACCGFYLTSVATRTVQESSQSPAAAWMPQLPERLCFDLTNTFTRNGEVLAYLFQGVLGTIFETEPHLDDPFFTRRQRVENLLRHFLQIDVDDGIGGRNHSAIFDEIAKM